MSDVRWRVILESDFEDCLWIVYGASDENRGFMVMGTQLHPKTEVVSGVLEEESRDLMLRFFSERRK